MTQIKIALLFKDQNQPIKILDIYEINFVLNSYRNEICVLLMNMKFKLELIDNSPPTPFPSYRQKRNTLYITYNLQFAICIFGNTNSVDRLVQRARKRMHEHY